MKSKQIHPAFNSFQTQARASLCSLFYNTSLLLPRMPIVLEYPLFFKHALRFLMLWFFTGCSFFWSSGFQPGGTISLPEDIWQCLETFLFSQPGRSGVLLASGGERTGTLLNLLKWREQSPTAKNYWVSNVSTIKTEKACSRAEDLKKLQHLNLLRNL